MSDARTDYPQLLSLAVHELRTPASVVAGYLRMLRSDPATPLTERQQKMVEEAEKSCGRMVALIAELSEVGKLDGGAAAVNTQSFDLFETIGTVAGVVHEGEDRGVQLVLGGDASGAPIKGDLTRLKTAFDAFFRAVLREQPSSCTVVVDRRRDVCDGVARAVVVVAEASVVQRTYVADRMPFDDKRGGLGLALPIAARVIERHGGSVWSPALPDVKAIVTALPLSESAR
jgi:signal transduction histidine kinase